MSIKERDYKGGEKLFRSLSVVFRADEDPESRTVEFSASSETPVDRYFGAEVLVHEAEAIDLGFFGGGAAPLLLDHDPHRQIGVVEFSELDTADRKLRCRVRFSRSPLASEIFDDVKDGIRSNVSIGYIIEKVDYNEKTNVAKVTKWTPLEVSIVSIPADMTVGVGRTAVTTISNPMETRMSEQNQSTTVELTDGQGAKRAVTFSQAELDARFMAGRTEAAEILDLGARHNMSDKAKEFNRDGKSLSEFRAHVLANLPQGVPLISQDIGMTRAETENFSVLRLARASNPQATKAERDDARFEIEAINAAAEMAERSGVKSRGFVMPAELLRNWIPRNSVMYYDLMQKRMINTTDDSALVPEDFRPGSFIDVLRNSMSVMKAGATILQGLQGNVDIPKKTAASTAAWVSAEGGNAAASEPTFGSVTMTPKDIAVYTDITRRSRQQMSPDIEALIRADIAMGVGLGIDYASLEGLGTGGQPLGVLNQVGINKPTALVGANPTFAEVVALETAVADDNGLMGNLAYILRSNMRGALKTAEKFASTGQTIWEPGDTLNGYPGIVSNQGTNGNIYFGNWSDVLIGMWSTLDLQFDYAALALSGGLRMIAFQTCDVAVRRAESFAWNT